jgi:hypothetical protein
MTKNSVVMGILLTLLPTLLLAGTGPRITFAAIEHDFGDVNHGQSPSVELTCANTGDELLILEKVESSCGCAKSVVGSPKIEPGASGKILAQVETLGMDPGRHSKTVHVFSNDPEHPRITLRLIFNVVRHVSVNPDILATCLLEAGKDAVFSLQAVNHSAGPITLKAGKTDGGPEIVLNPEEITARPGEKVNFQLSVRAKTEPGQTNLKGKAFIETTDDVDKLIPLRYFIQLKKGASQWD